MQQIMMLLPPFDMMLAFISSWLAKYVVDVYMEEQCYKV